MTDFHYTTVRLIILQRILSVAICPLGRAQLPWHARFFRVPFCWHLKSNRWQVVCRQREHERVPI